MQNWGWLCSRCTINDLCRLDTNNAGRSCVRMVNLPTSSPSVAVDDFCLRCMHGPYCQRLTPGNDLTYVCSRCLTRLLWVRFANVSKELKSIYVELEPVIFVLKVHHGRSVPDLCEDQIVKDRCQTTIFSGFIADVSISLLRLRLTISSKALYSVHLDSVKWLCSRCIHHFLANPQTIMQK